MSKGYSKELYELARGQNTLDGCEHNKGPRPTGNVGQCWDCGKVIVRLISSSGWTDTDLWVTNIEMLGLELGPHHE